MVCSMTDAEPGGAASGATGPPARPPGPAPPGYLPSEWVQQAPPPAPPPPPPPPTPPPPPHPPSAFRPPPTGAPAPPVPPEWYVVSPLLGLWIGFIGAPWLASRTQGTRNFVRDIGLRFRWWDLLGILIGLGGQVL